MNSIFSFKYVFFDLLELVENLTIEYGHNPTICHSSTFDSAVSVHGIKWKLKILSFADSKPALFPKALDEVIESIRKYLELHRLDLIKHYEEFISQLEGKLSSFEQLETGSITLEELQNKRLVKLNYKGYLPCDEIEEEVMKHGVLKTDHDEFAYKEIYRLGAANLKVLVNRVKKLIFLLGHEVNLAKTQQTLLANQKEDNEYLNLITRGSLEKSFLQLANDKQYNRNQDFILLSLRFNTLENNNRKGLMSIDDYQRHILQVGNSLIWLILKLDFGQKIFR